MKKIIYILGGARTGTTMLDAILGNAPDAFSCGEMYAWFRPWHINHYSIDCACGNATCPIWTKLKEYSEKEIYDAIFNELNVNYLIDSSANLAWVIDHNLRLSNRYDIINLVIWKDPITLYYSYWKRDIKKLTGLHSFSSNFKKYYGNIIKSGLPFYSIKYEDFVNDTSKVLKRLCEIIDIPYFEGKERFWEKEHHFLYGSYGVKKQILNKNSTIIREEPKPEKFKPQMLEAQNYISQDKTLSSIVNSLSKYDIMNENVEDSRSDKIIKPFYYYFLQMKRLYRKMFPAKFEIKYVSLGSK